MTKSPYRVRFAPSPTGFMHLGNVRSALMNYLFARQKNGTFILRIEDTDAKRNLDIGCERIIEDLAWLGLEFDEGPVVGGPYTPYFQSMRADIYQKHLEVLKERNLVYQCFCSPDELEQKRKRQLALKQPPRYDRACLKRTADDIAQKNASNTPFIWRFKLDEQASVDFYDLAHKNMHFDLKHFSDIPLTREDGSFTFMFANFVDDLTMKITHVFRGEDHLSNTAMQIALYKAFDAELPIFWHLPIIGNREGKKLSKRDFGFSLTDLKNGGYLPEAINNYLAIIGSTFKDELMNKPELIKAINFDHLSPTGMIKYDVEKLTWINHHVIMGLDIMKLTHLVRPFLSAEYPEVESMSDEDLARIIKVVQPEMVTLNMSIELLKFYFKRPFISEELLQSYGIVMYEPFIHHLYAALSNHFNTPQQVLEIIKTESKKHEKPLKDIFRIVRIALTGKDSGPSVVDLVTLLGADESKNRFENILVHFKK